jgi:hypothetical protein
VTRFGLAKFIRNLRGFSRVLPRGALYVAKLGRGYGRPGPTTGLLPEVRRNHASLDGQCVVLRTLHCLASRRNDASQLIGKGSGEGHGEQRQRRSRQHRTERTGSSGTFQTRPRPGLIAFHRPRLSKDGTHDEHPPARDEMLQVVRQALDVFAGLLLEALHTDDLRD